MSEAAKFCVLLPLLTSAAVAKIKRFVGAPPADVYTQAEKTLLRHFGKTKMEMAAELFSRSSLGDRTAVDFLEHMHSLQPGEAETSLFRYILLKAILEHVRISTIWPWLQT